MKVKRLLDLIHRKVYIFSSTSFAIHFIRVDPTHNAFNIVDIKRVMGLRDAQIYHV